MLLSLTCMVSLSYVGYKLMDIAEAGFLYFIMKMFLLFIGSMVIVLVVNKKMVLLLMDKIKK